jgi:hypothetical protein
MLYYPGSYYPMLFMYPGLRMADLSDIHALSTSRLAGSPQIPTKTSAASESG